MTLTPTIVTLTRILHPNRRIVAIKDLRNATRGGSGWPHECAMGLREAKLIVDDLADRQRQVEVQVYDLASLRESFEFVIVNRPDKVPTSLAMSFMLDVLAESDPRSARRIMALPSFRALREAV